MLDQTFHYKIKAAFIKTVNYLQHLPYCYPTECIVVLDSQNVVNPSVCDYGEVLP